MQRNLYRSFVVFGCIFYFMQSFTSLCASPAYNPPSGGEILYELASPQMLSGGMSVTGGAIPFITPSAILVNPALTAQEQRVVLDFSYTAIPRFGEQSGYGQAFNGGIIVPAKWGVFAGSMQGVFSELSSLPVGNNLALRVGFSKDIIENLFVGISLDTAFCMGKEFDWALNANLGMMYVIGNLSFMKNARWGVSLVSMGKSFKRYGNGIYTTDYMQYPAMFTLKSGFAASFIAVKNFELGASLDISLPSFQNLIVDVGLGILLFDVVSVRTAWGANVRELVQGYQNLYPSVGISVKCMIDTSKAAFLAKQGWQQSEIIPTIAFKSYDDNVTAFSGGLTMYLGLKDSQAPSIILGDEK